MKGFLFCQQKGKNGMASNHEGYDIGIHVNTDELEKSNKLVSAFNEQLEKANGHIAKLHGNPELTSNMKSLNSVTSEYVGKLKSSSEAYDKNKAAADSYQRSINQLAQKQQSLEHELSKIAETSGKTSDAYKNQQAKISSTSDAISKYKGKMDSARSAMETQVSTSNHLKTAMQEQTSGLDKVSAKQSNLRIKTDETRSSFGRLREAGSGIVNMATSVAIAMAPVGLAFKRAADEATNLQNRYLTIKNLMQTSGDSAGLAKREQRIMERRNRELSDEYGVSQSELAAGSEKLIRRGYSGTQEIASHPYFLQASMASNNSYNDVVDYGAPVLEGFGYKTKAGNSRRKMAAYTKKVLNEMAYTADLSAAGFSGIGNAMRYVSQTAHSNQISMANTLGALGVAANNGLDGTVAGTELKRVINSLVAPRMKGSQGSALRDMGLSQNSFLQNGHLRSLPSVFNILNNATSKFSAARKSRDFRNLFGPTGQEMGLVLARNYKQLNNLSNKAGSASDYNHGKGYIDTLSRKNMASFNNQYKIFKTNLRNVMIDIAKSLMPAMSRMLKSVNGVLSAFKKLPTPIKKGIGLGIAGLGTVGSVYVGSHMLKTGLHMIGIGGGAAKAGIHSGMLSGVLNATKSGGALQSIRSAGGLGGLSTMGKFATGAAGVGVALSSGLDLFSAIKAKNPIKKFHKYGNAIGGALGGGVGLFFGGPAGAAIGATVGRTVGGWAGDAVRKFSKSKIGKRIGKEMQPAVKAMSGVGKQIGRSWNAAWRYMSKGFGHMSQAFGQAVRGIGKSLTTFNRVTKPFQHVLETVFVHYVGTTMREFGHIFGGAFKLVGVLIAGSVRSTRDAFKFIGSEFALVDDLVHGKWTNAWKDAKNVFSGVFHYISDALDTLKNVFKTVFGTIGNVVKDVEGGIKGEVSGISHALGGGKHVKAHAAGGEIGTTHLALVGEAGKELAYKPYGNHARILGANGPEISKVHAGEHIFNARDTNRVLHGGLGNGLMLRGYANGTDKLTQKTATDYKVISDKSSKSLKSFYKTSSNLWDKINSTTTKSAKSIKNNSVSDYSKMNKLASKQSYDLSKNTVSDYSRMNKSASKQSSDLSKNTVSTAKDTTKSMLKQSDLMHDGVISSAKSMAKGFGNATDKLHGYAKNAMLDTIDQLNKGISGIDKVLDQFGGNSQVIKPVRFASGSNGELPNNTLAMVNDATSGPWQESIVQDGQLYIPRKRNQVLPIKRGAQVLNGYQTQELASRWGLTHFAGGSGVSKSALRKIINNGLANPNISFNKSFISNISENGADIAKDTTGLAKIGSSKFGIPWMQAIWQVLSNAMGGATGKGGTREGFLNYAESEFSGVPYVMGAMSKTASDCSGMVAQALRHFGINIGRTTEAMKHSAGVQYLGKSLSKTIPGDLVIFGHGNGQAGHVGIIKNPQAGSMFNETLPEARVTSIDDDKGMGYGYYRVTGLKNGNSKKTRTNSFLMALAKRELGTNALSWVKKHLSDDLDLGYFNIGGEGVKRWAPVVKKVLGLLHLSTSGSMISRVLRQISTESSGDPSARQPGSDPDGDGSGPALGLMQTKRSTFDAYKAPGHDNIFNGVDDIYAGLNYAKHVYGSSLSFLGQGHGYAKGGNPQVGDAVIVGEHGPEIAKFKQPVHVYSNDESKKLDFGKLLGKTKKPVKKASSPTINININGNISSEKTANKYAEIIEQKLNAIFNNIGEEFGGDPSVY